MRRHPSTVLVFLVLLSVLVVPALAQKQATVRPLEDVTPIPFVVGPTSSSQPPCVVGNLNPLAFAIPGFVLPPEKYALVFDPSVGCASCAVGIDISAVHIFLRTAAACDLIMGVDVQDVAKQGEPTFDPACPTSSPGAQICANGPVTVSLPAAGIWDVTIPIDCECFGVDRLYLLSFELLQSSCLPEPDLITDAMPSLCTSWNNFGPGWVDLVPAFGFPGNLSFTADADCCSPTVGVEQRSWGTIKKLYDQ